MIISTLLFTAAISSTPVQQSPYAGQEQRPIKALSPADIEAYRLGQGHGFARAAELNRYPGPKHVLDLAGPLALTDSQRDATQALFDAMAQRAQALGAQLIDAERELDRAFADRTIDAQSLREHVSRIGQLHAEIRFTHLQAHLAQVEILDAVQIARYDDLRGYASPSHDIEHHGHSH